MCLSKALTSNACFLTTYSNKEKTKLFQVYLGEWVKIEFVIENHVYLSVGHLLSWFSSAILVHII